MLNFKKILVLIILLVSVASTHSNPFLNNQNSNKIPTLRPYSAPQPEYLIELQMEFRAKISELLIGIEKNRDFTSITIIIFIGFIYGIIHAIGPGHRKSVLFTIFLTNKSKWWEPGIAGIFSAFLHGLSGIILILIIKGFSTRFFSSNINISSKYLEIISFILLMVIAIILIINKLISIFKKNCIINNDKIYYTIFLSSIFPCPGAILILILALSLNILYIGIITVISLSIGMGVTISITAYIGRSGRVGLFKLLKDNEKLIFLFTNYLELLGYMMLFVFSFWILLPIIQNI